MGSTARKKLSEILFSGLAGLIPSKAARYKLRQRYYPAIQREYPGLRMGGEWKSMNVHGLENESSQIFGQVVVAIGDIEGPIGSMLLAGESGRAKKIYGKIAGIPPERITTAGLHDDADHVWNFEEDAPEIGSFDCIVSHAIMEHLIDPYRHMRDLASLLSERGQLVVFTVAPGFPYHRHPVDCMRFFPDWFEVVAQRIGLEILDSFLGDERIMYRFRRK